MTIPLHTDRLADTDLFIKGLAYRVDAALAGTLYAVTRAAGPLTVDAAGWITVPFPGLTTLAGCVVHVSQVFVYGQRSNLDPVPPATIGAFIGATQAVLVPSNTYAGNTVRVLCMTSPWRSSNGASTMGAQPIKSGTPLQVSGIAWGTP